MPASRLRFSGAKIRQARHAAGLTQAALAHAINTRERNIIRWENDQHEPRFENVAAIAHATGHPLEFFSTNGDDEAGSDDEESDPVAALENAIRRIVRAEVVSAVRAEVGSAA